ncbi:hypothetical protein BC940DRAFT_292986 [Gongronella butleri]|nr:hypothetical protein BC940DRAFT_292986 [Gongronella butleri]
MTLFSSSFFLFFSKKAHFLYFISLCMMNSLLACQITYTHTYTRTHAPLSCFALYKKGGQVWTT